MLKKALSGLDRLHKPGLPGLTEPPVGKAATDSKETGIWSYLVTDLSGIRPRQEPVYSTSKESSAKRYPAGTVVEVHERLRSGWTKWLRLAEGGWLFDISPKDRKARFPRWPSSGLPAWLMCSGLYKGACASGSAKPGQEGPGTSDARGRSLQLRPEGAASDWPWCVPSRSRRGDLGL
ncbi:unnamed protein product [Symbiodinium microadriaticum]|nr:unnamed protein product [Symbiodinium microadriaticum]